MTLLAVVVGALAGTGLRLGTDALLPHEPDGFPVSTLLVNVLGSFALGVLVARVWPTTPGWVRAGLGPGLLGSFTTFSAVIASALSLVLNAQPIVALVFVVVSVAAGLAAAALGLRLGGVRRAAIAEAEE